VSKKKFTQNISDILAEDLATLESIEPGAALRPELQQKSAAPGEASASRSPTDAGDADQPELFGAPSETAASLPREPATPAPATPAPAPRRRARRARRQPPAVHAEDAPTPTPGLEPTMPEAPEPAPRPDSEARSERQPEPQQKPKMEPSLASPPEPGPAPSSRRPRARRGSAGGGRGPGSNRDAGDGDQPVTDTVTRLEITSPAEGGIRERALPGDRSLSPPSPPRARRGWNHPVARWITYVVVVIVLTAIFLVLLVDIFHLG
jgi:hypothetical protein